MACADVGWTVSMSGPAQSASCRAHTWQVASRVLATRSAAGPGGGTALGEWQGSAVGLWGSEWAARSPGPPPAATSPGSVAGHTHGHSHMRPHVSTYTNSNMHAHKAELPGIGGPAPSSSLRGQSQAGTQTPSRRGEPSCGHVQGSWLEPKFSVNPAKDQKPLPPSPTPEPPRARPGAAASAPSICSPLDGTSQTWHGPRVALQGAGPSSGGSELICASRLPCQ